MYITADVQTPLFSVSVSDNCTEQRSDWRVERLDAVGYSLVSLLRCKQGMKLFLIAPWKSKIGFSRINEVFLFFSWQGKGLAQCFEPSLSTNVAWVRFPGGGVLPEKMGRGARPASQNPYPIYDQNLWFSLPYLWPDQKFDTLFITWPLNLHPVSDLL